MLIGEIWKGEVRGKQDFVLGLVRKTILLPFILMFIPIIIANLVDNYITAYALNFNLFPEGIKNGTGSDGIAAIFWCLMIFRGPVAWTVILFPFRAVFTAAGLSTSVLILIKMQNQGYELSNFNTIYMLSVFILLLGVHVYINKKRNGADAVSLAGHDLSLLNNRKKRSE